MPIKNKRKKITSRAKSSRGSNLKRKVKALKKKRVGRVTHYFNGIKVAVVKAAAPLRVGQKIEFASTTKSFVQSIGSMQYDHVPISRCPKGKAVGIKVKRKVSEGTVLYAY